MKKFSGKVCTVLVFAFMAHPVKAEVDAIEAKVETEDADRFAAIFEASGGAPDAVSLQSGYLDPGSPGVKIFTPGRIEDADNLAAAIAANPQDYRRAIDVCLPIAKSSSSELRSVYLALQGLLGDPDLPHLYALFGAGNSGGTAAPGAQVLGLEVICRLAQSEAEIREVLRGFYAHETVHTLQGEPTDADMKTDLLLTWALQEGVADYVASLVTGVTPNPGRAAWAQARESELWADFNKDRKKVNSLAESKRAGKGSPTVRWFANANNPPEGWPSELGYWIGMRIAEAYVDASEDKRAAVAYLINQPDPAKVLEQSGYAKRFASKK